MKRLFVWWTMMCVMSAVSVVAQSHQGHSHAKVKRSDANIVGHVIDAASGQHVAFVNVTLKGTTIGTTTDESGKRVHSMPRSSKTTSCARYFCPSLADGYGLCTTKGCSGNFCM